MKIALGADQAGQKLKEELQGFLLELDHEVLNVSADTGAHVDYPEPAHRVALEVSAGRVDRGLLVCGTGVGMAMAANRHPGVRAANCTDLYTARMARAHNDANVLTLGGRVIALGLARELLRTFLETPFDGGRHTPRVARIESTEGATRAEVELEPAVSRSTD